MIVFGGGGGGAMVVVACSSFPYVGSSGNELFPITRGCRY